MVLFEEHYLDSEEAERSADPEERLDLHVSMTTAVEEFPLLLFSPRFNDAHSADRLEDTRRGLPSGNPDFTVGGPSGSPPSDALEVRTVS